MNKINYKKYGKIHPITLEIEKYLDNNGLAIRMTTWEEGYAEPWSSLTVNLIDGLDDDCAFVDTNNNGNDILCWIAENKLGVPTGRTEFSGYCEYPEYKFDLSKLM